MTVESLVKVNSSGFYPPVARNQGRYGEGAGDFGSLLAGLLQQPPAYLPAGGLTVADGGAGARSRVDDPGNRYAGRDAQPAAAGSQGREEALAARGSQPGEAQPAFTGAKDQARAGGGNISGQAGNSETTGGQKPTSARVATAGDNSGGQGKAAGSANGSSPALAGLKAAAEGSKAPATAHSAGKAGTPGAKQPGTPEQAFGSEGLTGTTGKQGSREAPGTPTAVGHQPELPGKTAAGKTGLDGQSPPPAAGAGQLGEQQSIAGSMAKNVLNPASAKGEEARVPGATAKADAEAGQAALAAGQGASTVTADVAQAGNKMAGSSGNTGSPGIAANPGDTGKVDPTPGTQPLIPGSQPVMKDGPLAVPRLVNQGAGVIAGQAGTAGSAGNRGSASYQEPGVILPGNGSGATGNAQGPVGPVSFAAVLGIHNLPASDPAAGVNNLPEVIASALTAARLSRTGSQRELDLQLQPENLGSLKLRASLEGGRMILHLLVESSEAARAIQAAVPEMRQAVAGQGLRLDQVQVQVGGDGQAGDNQNGGNGGYHRGDGRQPQAPLWPEAAVARDATGNYRLNYLA